MFSILLIYYKSKAETKLPTKQAFIDTEQYHRIRTSECKKAALQTNIYQTNSQLKKNNIIVIS